MVEIRMKIDRAEEPNDRPLLMATKKLRQSPVHGVLFCPKSAHMLYSSKEPVIDF